ncbi:MAG: hypothetical protein U9R02_09215 [Thermodesulfobacteriota bacterium]|nr:hypothetical protein [Thermodesulfobacteriota bacterium]
MKRIVLIFILGLFLSGCGTLAKESELWEHDTMYKNWDHLKFSIYGFEHPSIESLKKTDEQGWWGLEIPINATKN